MVRIKDNRDFYDADASTYDERWMTPGGAYNDQVQQGLISELCVDWAGKEVLEIGCGTGRFSATLARLGAQLSLVDLSSRMLECTSAHLRSLGLFSRVRCLMVGSIYDLPFIGSSFDCILTINVFNHLEKTQLAFAQCARVIRPNGHFAFNYPSLCSYYLPVAYRINHMRRAVGQDVFSRWMRPTEVARMVQGAGFEVLRWYGQVHVPRSLQSRSVNRLLCVLDRVSRSKPLSHLAPIRFCLCRKVR